ncbi:DnaJ-domain-containing protein, partial [Linderina pennispora]
LHTMDDTDYYDILGVSPAATDKDLAKAYRAKALQHHPDKNRDNPSAVHLFHLAKLAYDTLADAQQRSAYDEKRRAQLAKRQRHDAMSSQRKRMKSQLEKSESSARMAREKERERQEMLRVEAERFRREAMRSEWARDRAMREQVAQASEPEPAEEAD